MKPDFCLDKHFLGNHKQKKPGPFGKQEPKTSIFLTASFLTGINHIKKYLGIQQKDGFVLIRKCKDSV